MSRYVMSRHLLAPTARVEENVAVVRSSSTRIASVSRKELLDMKLLKLRFVFVCIFLLASLGSAIADKASGPPQLINRDLIFGNPEIAAAQLSPDGKYVAFLKPWKDTRNVYVKAVDEPFSAARLLTTETKRPVAGYFWTRDSKYILYAKDNDGDEN